MAKKNDHKQFIGIIWDFYGAHGRSFPWRMTCDPYCIVISEIMLQQTQTHRVIPKYEQFINALPTCKDLADAPLGVVLNLWQGLGYNRRGQYLSQLAKRVMLDFGGVFPTTQEQLITLPGIGKNTAGSICAFAYNKPTVFIETNIRTVFINAFFSGRDQVDDRELLPLIEKTLDHDTPREWYYALMDYGAYLKQQLPNPSRKSAHHAKQSKFQGSDRQIRGAIIRLLTQHHSVSFSQLCSTMKVSEERIEPILQKLSTEHLIIKKNDIFSID